MQYEARKRVLEIQGRTGHVIGVDDLDDLARLDALAEKVADVGGDDNLDCVPAYVGGRPVYPLSIAKLEWLETVPPKDCRDERLALVMAWLVSEPSIAPECWDWRAADRAARAWARSCSWTPDQVRRILDMRYKRPAGSGGKGEASAAPLVAMLCREYGESPDYWMGAPLGVINAMVSDWTRRQEAEAAAYRKAYKGKGAPPPAPSPKIEAMKRFREFAEELERKWQTVA